MTTSAAIAPCAGAGLKAEHIDAILATHPPVGWFEIHAENYMGEGGPPHHYLRQVRQRYPLSLHGVGLSIGASGPLDEAHLARLKALDRRYEPGLFSEHLAWSSHDEIYYNDLLPIPYDRQTLDRVCDHIDRVQEVMQRQMLLENPSTYVDFDHSTLTELEFLQAVVQRTGCGLLLDINNVFVSATNHQRCPEAYLDALPLEAVQEIHLGGHAEERDDSGAPLLIDAHDRPVDAAVWRLYRRLIARTGPLPTLIEWDNDLPDWPTLFAEVERADAILAAPKGCL